MSPEEARTAIFRAIRAIPKGRVAAYGDVAARAGLPGRARLVGKVLREAARSTRLPWYRVLRADGRVAFPEDSPAYIEQLQRLAVEGVTARNGRVPGDAFAWRQRNVDAELWGPQ